MELFIYNSIFKKLTSMKRQHQDNKKKNNKKEAANIYLKFLFEAKKKTPKEKQFNMEEMISHLYYRTWIIFFIRYIDNDTISKPLKRKLNKLNLFGLYCFLKFVYLIIEDVENSHQKNYEMFFKKFYKKEVKDIISLFILALNICYNIRNPIEDDYFDFDYFNFKNDCWIYNNIRQDGYPRIYFKESEVRMDNNSKQQRYRILKVQNGISCRLRCHRWVTGLQWDLKEKDHAAHRCGIKSCINPGHLKAASSQENYNDINCRNGCYNFCPHNPKCIWTVKGKWAPCRNDTYKAIKKNDCPHNPNCFN